MLTRRSLLLLAGAGAALAALRIAPARADSAGATEFVKRFADQLVAIVNGNLPNEQKEAALAPALDDSVDVPGIARFCLGRFWAAATPAQQAEYTKLFHQVLLNNIAGHLGEYQGVSYQLTGTHDQGGETLVGTTINRPNAPSADVQWVVSDSSGGAKVEDVIAEGTSLRITQRNDYGSYLGRHGGDIDALIAAMKRQLAAG